MFYRFLCAILMLLWGGAALAQAAERAAEQSTVTIPLKGAGAFGSAFNMHAEVFKPAGQGPFPVMVYAHGRSGTQQERNALREVIPREYLRFWIDRGFAAVGVARPGYGLSGGQDRENPGHTWERSGNCGGNLNPQRVAETAGAAVMAAIDWVRQQPWAKRDAIVVTGNSVGGMTAVFIGAQSPEGVMAFINFAGGVGGNPALAPGRSCTPEKIGQLFGTLGAVNRLPNLWLYAENDRFWGRDAPRNWHAQFAAPGKGPTTMVMTPAVPAPDGHDLIFVGRSLWEPFVNQFLKDLGL